MVKLKENDVYALKITGTKEEYNGRYIILIKTSVKGWSKSINKSLFRLKITKEKRLPTLDEIKELDYVIVNLVHELELISMDVKYGKDKDYPTSYEETMDRIKKKISNIKIYPDNYGYVSSYLMGIRFNTEKIPEEFIYLGNRKYDRPENEFIPYSEFDRNSIRMLYREGFIPWLIMLYELYNLKSSEMYTDKAYERIKSNYFEEMRIHNLFRKMNETGLTEKIAKMLDEIDGGRIEEDTLTYVGGEDKDPYDEKED